MFSTNKKKVGKLRVEAQFLLHWVLFLHLFHLVCTTDLPCFYSGFGNTQFHMAKYFYYYLFLVCLIAIGATAFIGGGGGGGGVPLV